MNAINLMAVFFFISFASSSIKSRKAKRIKRKRKEKNPLIDIQASMKPDRISLIKTFLIRKAREMTSRI